MSNKIELQQYRDQLKEQIKVKEAITRLSQNEDFIKKKKKGFCENEMQRTLGLAVSERINPETRELCNQLAKASAALQNYLHTQVHFGTLAEEELSSVEEQLASPELDEEEAN